MIREHTLRRHASLASEARRLELSLPELMNALGFQDPWKPLKQALTVQQDGAGMLRAVGLTQARRPKPPHGAPTGCFHTPSSGLELKPGVALYTVLAGSRDRMGFDVLRVDPGAWVELQGRSTDRRFVVLAGEGNVVGEGLDAAVRAGDVVRVRRGHPLRVAASEGSMPMRLLIVSTPTTGQLKGSHVCALDPHASFFKAVESCEINQVANDPRDPAVSVVRVRVEVDKGTAPHRVDVNERYFITRGTGFVEVGGVQREVGPGDLISIPKGVCQRISNTGEETMEFYAICASAFRKTDYHEVGGGR